MFWKWRHSVFWNANDNVNNELHEERGQKPSSEVTITIWCQLVIGSGCTAFSENHLIKWSMTHVILCLCSHYPYSVFVPITLSVFSPNAEKYRPEITPYLDNYHAEYIVISRCILYHYWIRIQQQHHMEL